jgi:hypothetical protein
MVAGQGVQQTSAELPSHERHRGPAEGEMTRGFAERAVVAALHQGDPARRVVADRGGLLIRPRGGRGPGGHSDRIARRLPILIVT